MELNINGQAYNVSADPPQPLLWVLRDELGLIGTKFGCGVGICGACVVHVDGVPTRSCLISAVTVAGANITTIEGLATQATDGTITLHPVQQAFLDEQAPQCSWCMSGQMMTAVAFLSDNPHPNRAEIVEAMSRNYCRCGCYHRVRLAVAKAAELLTEETA